MEIRARRLDEKDLKHFEHMADTRFNCVFWGSVNVKRVIQRLLGHIKYLEKVIELLEKAGKN